MATVTDAAEYARRAHDGQRDLTGQDYVTAHLDDVAARVRAGGGDDDAVMTAYLHDTIEDTPTTAVDLLAAGFPDHVVDTVATLTRHPEEEGYERFIDRVAAQPLARRVKIADLESNLDPARMAALQKQDPVKAARLRQRYEHALVVLRAHSDQPPVIAERSG